MKKSIKKLIAIGIIASSICMLPITGVNASWKQNSDNTWSYDNVTNGWFKDNSNWYFFKDGTMQTGWIKDNSGEYYYLSSNGSMLSNTTTPDGYKVGNDGRLNSKLTEIFKDENSLGIFESASELERKSEELFGVKLHTSNISAVCNGREKTHKGFTFKYITEEQIKEIQENAQLNQAI